MWKGWEVEGLRFRKFGVGEGGIRDLVLRNPKP